MATTVGDDWAIELLGIIDNLSKRGVKKYSEKQVRKWYNEYHATTLRNQFHAQDCVIAALKHFGALEEK